MSFSKFALPLVLLGAIGAGPAMADCNISDAQLDEFLRNVRAIIDNAVTPLPSHEDFIKKFCAAG